MKKMYSESQVIELVKQAFEEGKISGGTKLYIHEIDFTEDEETVILIDNNSNEIKEENDDRFNVRAESCLSIHIGGTPILCIEDDTTQYILYLLEGSEIVNYNFHKEYTDTISLL